MKKPRFLLKIRIEIAKIFYSIFNPIENSIWRRAIENADSFRYQFSFGNYTCFASQRLNVTAIYHSVSGLVILCGNNYMTGPSSCSYSEYLGTLLKNIKIQEFSFPVIPPDAMLFSIEEEEVVAKKELNKNCLSESSQKFATEFYKKNFGFVPKNIEPDILYFYTSGYREGRKEILENYLKLPYIRIKNNARS